MRRRLTAVPLAILAVLLAATPAIAASQVLYVEGTGDSALAGCQPIPGGGGAVRCDSLRAAVAAANSNPNSDDGTPDIVFLQAAGEYALTQGSELTLTDDVTIYGRGPRTTTVRGGGSARVLSVAQGVQATLFRFTIAGGRETATASQGGNVLNFGELSLYRMRLTDGQAQTGGGIANVGPGDLLVLNSLIDHNTASAPGRTAAVGGGIASVAGPGAAAPLPARLTVVSSTVAFNAANATLQSGGGIFTGGSTQNDTTLAGVTVARNTTNSTNGGTAGIHINNQGETADIYGSIVTRNTWADGEVNCGGSGTLNEGSGASNREDNTTCPFEVHGSGTGISANLVDAGGDTDVFTFPATSSAKNAVTPCQAAVDQRDAPRDITADCDAGAFEEGASAPPIDSGPAPEPGGQVEVTPTATPQATAAPTATASPTPSATPTATPEAGKSVGARTVSGTVLVKLPGSSKFVPLDPSVIRNGAEIDARKGVVEITRSDGGVAKFYDGIFKLSQSGGITTLTLSEKLTGCPKAKRASAAAAKPKTRKLWGDGKGKFRTRGQYSAATVRGTKWLVQDGCRFTLTRVTQGSVTVRDEVKKKNIVLRKGKSYTARPRR